MMKKTIAAGTIALMLAGAGAALAQSAPPREGMRMRPSAEDVAAFTDARIAALKAGLKLTAEQEKNWPAVEAALRDIAKQRAERANAMTQRGEARRGSDSAAQPAPDAIARMREGADGLTRRADNLKKLADASEPLYKSLDDAQKRRFDALIRAGGRPMMGHHRMMHRQGAQGR
ncbi:MAG: Spy/CpxP family protein refolding chaperone [Xanthobacteraceae bacterium]|nr:Spy/CpxP family protein refolding chaperone [Xanthobacteraceae bacterium]